MQQLVKLLDCGSDSRITEICAKTLANLTASAKWLKEAAEAGNTIAMAEYGVALVHGYGVAPDPAGALPWLDKAAQAGHDPARDLARLLRLGTPP